MKKAMTVAELAAHFDHTLLKAFAQKTDFEKLCRDSADYGFKMVAINSTPVKLCKELLKGTDVRVGAAISFPLGQTSLSIKVREAEQAIADGADEIDYVINIGRMKEGDVDYIKKEMQAIVELCRQSNTTSKIIFETCYLTPQEIKIVAGIAREVGPDFIKTSTGFGTAGATVENVRLMKDTVGERVKVKASGGIRDLETCLAMIEAGAERIGSSSSIEIVEAYKKTL